MSDAAMSRPETTRKGRQAAVLGLVALVVVTFAAWLASSARAQDLQSALSQKRTQLEQTRTRQAALSTTLERYSHQIEALSAQVATLRDREARVQQELDLKTEQLRVAEARLARLRARLRHALNVLRQRLVAIYESDMPDIVTVILDSRGFDDLVSRSEYLTRIQRQDTSIVGQVARLRDRTRGAVERIRAARVRLAAERDALARTESQLESRQSALAGARDRKQRILSAVESNTKELQGAISDLQKRIQAAQTPSPSASGVLGTTAPGAVPLGPVPPGQAISPFPASSSLTWGRTDQGVDGTTDPGSPLLAMGTGTVTIGHDPAGFGASYPIIHTSFGDFYYGHCVPIVSNGAHVSIGQPIATAHYGTWGNSTTPGGFEIGAWPPGDMTAGAAIRDWLIGLPRR
jgi:peptidoglycan hydrolase CwlO-like protein